MKLAVTAEGPELDSRVDPRFGRCPYFILIDPDTMAPEPIANPFIDRQGGAGIQAGKLMAERGVTAVLTGRCGPNAEETLTTAGIRIVADCGGSVREAVEQFKAQQGAAGTAQPASAAAPPHQQAPAPAPAMPGAGPMFGRGGGGRGPCGGGWAMRHGRGFGRRGGM